MMTSQTVQLMLNGKPYTSTATTLAVLVEQLALTNRRFAIEVDEHIVPKSRFSQTPLHNGMCIEVVQAVGGG